MMNELCRDGEKLSNQQCSRRKFLQAGSLAVAGFSGLAAPLRANNIQSPRADAAIQIILSGGPSQLDTWDPKPQAPSSIRGPFRAIRTTVPGMQISELFPEMARRAEQFAIVRSITSNTAPVHEVGLDILEASCSQISGAHATLDNNLWPCASLLNSASAEPRYGGTEFGRRCREAVHLIQSGTRFVKIRMFPFPLYDSLTWDCHANEADLPTTLEDYRTTICPMFDHAFTAMIDDLAALGLLQRTLVVCAGEFGRSPKLNPRGGRDHWTGVSSAIFAGGGVRGGQVIGSSDRLGGEPKDLPLDLSQIPATIGFALGSSMKVDLRRNEKAMASPGPILELF